MEIDTSNLTDEQISKLSEYVHKMEEGNTKVTKWWIMPKYSMFSDMTEYEKYGPCYYVEPEQFSYSRSKPPLKSGFESKEAAQKWLDDYLKEEDLFSKAKDEINNLKCNLGHIFASLNQHVYVTKDDWLKCFGSFNTSMDHGSLKEVTKDNEKD